MDIQKDFLNMQIAYEKNCAIRCNCSYEELKAQLDRSESLFGTRYLEGSPRHENWLLWVEAWQAATAQAVPEGFVLISAEQLSQWGHMANYAEQYGCPECFEARGYAHSLACEINEFFAIEPQEPSNNVTPELVNNAVTYVIELQGYEAIEYARVTLNKKGYKTWDYTDKDSIDDTDIYVLCVCPSTPNDSAFVKGTFKGIHQGKFTYIQSDLESCPDAQEPAND